MCVCRYSLSERMSILGGNALGHGSKGNIPSSQTRDSSWPKPIGCGAASVGCAIRVSLGFGTLDCSLPEMVKVKGTRLIIRCSRNGKVSKMPPCTSP